MPLLAAVAVALSTAMVLITWSVMGGFLKTLLESGREVIGDVKIDWAGAGFPYYDELVERLEADELIAAAAPRLETFGMIGLPGDRAEPAAIVGIEPESFSRVTGYEGWLYWKPIDEPTSKDAEGEDRRLTPLIELSQLLDWPFELNEQTIGRLRRSWAEVLEAGRTLTAPNPRTGEPVAAAVIGIELSGFNRRKVSWYDIGLPIRVRPDGTQEVIRTVLPINGTITLNTAVFDGSGKGVDQVTRIVPVANEFQTGVHEIDKRTVFVRMDLLQEMMNMDRAERLVEPDDPFAIEIDPATGEERFAQSRTEIAPARVTTVLVRAGEGASVDEVVARCRSIFAEFAAAHPGEVPPANAVTIETWEDINRTLIEAVRKETGLVLFVFSFISLTAVFLVWAIFWSMVSEKTRDIGILRSLGASRTGVAWLWLRYAIVIGLVGAAAGGLIAYAIVVNINPIHEWLGEAFGFQIWDPSVYYFTRIPSEVNPRHATIVLVGGIAAAVAGSALPAMRAARMHPVKALRFE